MAESTCPRCGDALASRAFGAVELDGCPRCGGIWFDRGELNQVTRDPEIGLIEVERAFERVLARSACHGPMDCPRCRSRLVPYTFPHTPDIPVSICLACKGVWLDDGEVEQLAERIHAHRRNRAHARAPLTGEGSHRHRASSAIGFLLSVACPSCGATSTASALTCGICGAPIASREAPRLCPRCDCPLTAIDLMGIKLDACGACRGGWLEEGRLPVFLQLTTDECAALLAALRAVEEEDPVGRPPAGQPRCPACHHELQAHAFGAQTIVDVHICVHCRGTWHDAGKLKAAHELVQREGFLSMHGGDSDLWSRG